MTAKRISQPSRAARGGLLFPDGPTRRDRRPLALLAFLALGAGLIFMNSRRTPPPPPVSMIAVRPGAAAVPAARPVAGAPVPTTWEELTAARAAAAAARVPPVAVEPEPAAERDVAPAPRTRRQPERRRETLPPPPASEPAPAAPADPESSAPGRLTASSSPWGQLIVDGRLYGNTPRLNLPIATGTRRIRIARDGFEPFDTTITVQPGEAIRLTGITLRAQP